MAIATAINQVGEPTMLAIMTAGAFFFGLSGGLSGAEAKLDPFGVIALGAAVGLSGGIIRDTMLGIPGVTILDWRVILAVVVAGVIAYFASHFLLHIHNSILYIEALGISLFCVIGTGISIQHHAGLVGSAILGTLTAVGGGIVRDIVLRRIPVLFREGFYGTPTLIGSIVVVIGHEIHQDTLWWYALAATICFIARILGMRYKVNLPAARFPVSRDESGTLP